MTMIAHGFGLTLGGVATFLSVATAWGQPGQDQAVPSRLLVYVGTYTRGEGEGIFRYQFDLASGKLSLLGTTSGLVNPSFVAIDPTNRFLYAVNEISSVDGKRGGAVAAYSIDPAGGELTFLNRQSSGGPGPCHLVVDRAGKNVLVANYGGGSVAVLPIGDDGHLKEASAFVQHVGSSVNPRRQQGPHAHSVNVDPANRFAFVADLGLDKVLVYRFDAAQGTLAPNEEPWARVDPGAGPRHFAFHPSGKFAYVINELASTVTAFAYDAQRGSLRSLQTISTLPRDFDGDNTTAEVQVHPTGRFLYGSNRGHDSIAVFRIDAGTGALAHVGNVSTGGSTPRNFGMDPTGAYLLAANQATDNIVVFRIDAATGALTPTGHSVDVPKPVCIKMIPLGSS